MTLMRVTFTRTAERRYRVDVVREQGDPLLMNPAPGYDSELPHDVMHFLVERELGLHGAVFGQLAAGGTAGTFRPAVGRIGGRLARKSRNLKREGRAQMQLSERLVQLCHARWLGRRLTDSEVRELHAAGPVERVFEALDATREQWRALPIGGSLTLDWARRAPPAKRS